MLLAPILLVLSAQVGTEAATQVRPALERRIRERLFLDSELGFDYRRLAYAEGAQAQRDDRGEVRAYVSGEVGSGADPFGAYLGLGFVARPSFDPTDGDPLADPFDELTLSRSVRLFEGYAQYVLRDMDDRPRLSIQAGRMSDLIAGSGLLLYDGARATLNVGHRLRFVAYGGRRATLDRGLRDGHSDVGAQLITGFTARGQFGHLVIEGGHRFEEAHIPSLSVSWSDETVHSGLRAEVISASGRDVAAVLRADAEAWFTPSTVASLVAQLQFGDDPRDYGRSGLTADVNDIAESARVEIVESELDRLFFGTRQPHVLGQLDVAQWITSELSVRAGAFARVPFGDVEQGRRPQIVELWFGPDVAFSSMFRVGAEARYAFEDPGDPGAIFAPAGDGERRFGSARLYGEVAFAIAEEIRLAIAPELMASVHETRGPLVDAKNQVGAGGTLLVTASFPGRIRAALRYGLEQLPELEDDGVDLAHDVGLWMGWSY